MVIKTYEKGFQHGYVDAQCGISLDFSQSTWVHYSRGYRDGQQAYKNLQEGTWAQKG